MKYGLLILFVCCLCTRGLTQDEPATTPGNVVEQQLENLAEQVESDNEDDSFLQSLLQYQKTKININTVDAAELRELKLLSALQIVNFIRYRELMGSFISLFELQAIPTWDVDVIRKLLPYLRVGNSTTLRDDVGTRFSLGKHSLLLRAQQVLEQSEGFARPDSIANRYLGSRQRVFFRYKYVYRNLLQFGITGDKDAGEQFFKGAQKRGFDFYSMHLFARKIGPIQLLALGDFTVNMGQGLIQWQSLAFKKSADITAIKRQADILRPYNSATEFNFERGAGATFKVDNFQATVFASRRKEDATVVGDTFANVNEIVTAIALTGLHRTPNEIAKKNSTEQIAFGGNLSYQTSRFHLGFNTVHFQFSKPIERSLQLYNQFGIRGTNWRNYSVDYSYTYKNLHFFGEVAIDKRYEKAVISGLLMSLDPKVDASLVYRNINQKYQALYGNAFTEGTYPTNENGLFAGIGIKPSPAIKIDAYADVFSFPWLRYRVDAPSKGFDYFVQFTYRPNKQVEMYTRYRNESKAINLSNLQLPTRLPFNRPRQDWRTQISYKISRDITLRNRIEMLWYDNKAKDRSEEGFLAFVDATYRPLGRFAANARLLYFETDGFDSRLYTFENDVLYSFSIPAFFDKGYRYYVNINYDVTQKLTFWLRLAQTTNLDKREVGSGLDKIGGNKRTEVKVQAMYNF